MNNTDFHNKIFGPFNHLFINLYSVFSRQLEKCRLALKLYSLAPFWVAKYISSLELAKERLEIYFKNTVMFKDMRIRGF